MNGWPFKKLSVEPNGTIIYGIEGLEEQLRVAPDDSFTQKLYDDPTTQQIIRYLVYYLETGKTFHYSIGAKKYELKLILKELEKESMLTEAWELGKEPGDTSYSLGNYIDNSRNKT